MNIYLKWKGTIVGTFPQTRTDQRSVMREVTRLLKKQSRGFEVDYSEFQDLWDADELAQYEDPMEVYGE